MSKAMDIANQLIDKKDIRKAMMFLQRYGIQMNLANKIFKRYGNDIYNILEQNPYRLADDIEGVGFRTADEIASRAGIKIDSEFRIKSGIFYVLNQARMQGHTYLPYDKLVRQVNELLLIDVQDYDKYLMDLTMDKKIVVKVKDNVKCVYARMYYNMEANVAAMLNNLDVQIEEDQKFIDDRIARIEDKEGITLDDIQKEAVAKAVRNGLVIVTGGPGTGKTTTINTIIKYFELEGLEIRLAAPTGRAAKRMTEACGYEAQTIHRMLEISGGVPDGDRKSAAGLSMFFERNEDNPLEADVIIVDEMSMVDISIMNSLLKAVSIGTKLILVGDVDQLPVELFDAFDYVALGHIHSPQKVGRETVRYCGSPLKYSFSEAGQEKSITIVELKEKGTVELRTIPLKPLHDLRKIRGTYLEVTAKTFYENSDRTDYLMVTLTDEEDVPDGMAKLRTIYPNLMRLEYDNKRTRSNAEVTAAERIEEKSELELFQEFYELQNNQSMTEQQKAFVKALLRGIKR